VRRRSGSTLTHFKETGSCRRVDFKKEIVYDLPMSRLLQRPLRRNP